MSNPFGSASGAPGGGQEGKTGAERREAARRALRAHAMVLLPGQPGRMGRTLDVSETGLCITMTESLPSGTECMVGFELPDKAGNRKRLQSKARVVHSVLSSGNEGFKIGMQLQSPPDDVVRALQAFVRE